MLLRTAYAPASQNGLDEPQNNSHTSNDDSCAVGIKDTLPTDDEGGGQENGDDDEICASQREEQCGRCRRRCCCCCTDCTRPKFFTIILHIYIMCAALVCFVPTGVMVSVMRARLGGITTLIWIIYCCVMILANGVYILRRYNNTKGRNLRDDNNDVTTIDEEQQAGESTRLVSTCNEMGCLCFVGPSSTKSTCRGKVPCPLTITILLIIEGILLLVPVFASTSTYTTIDVEIDNVFPTASTIAPNPQTNAFSFNKYLLPGGFSQYGGYDNNPGNAKTFRYKEGCKPECEFDIHIPQGDDVPVDGYPVIFEVHGGGWDSGDKSATKYGISYWLERGYAFVSIQYRFPSQTPGGSSIFEQLDDVEDAFNYMTLIGADHGLDTSRVLFTGDSAGGHLACVVAYRSGSPSIKGVMNFYGATEFEYYVDTGGKLLLYLMDKLYPATQFPDGATEDDYRAASCSTYVTSSSPPLLTIHGTWDTLVPIRLSEYLHSVLDDLGIPNLLVKLPLGDHVLEAGFYSVGGQLSTYAMERFVAARLFGS